ncbi:MAG TPA: DUF6263 family protein [Blastocatellia bacterium]|nr:DUF6263 family protein [Blastocatellia bacterium]
MKTRAKVIFILLVMLMPLTSAAAQERFKLAPAFKQGQQERYTITAQVDQVITPTGGDGISSNVHREFTATVLWRTVGVDDKGIITQEATIEEVSYRDLIEGKDRPSSENALTGQSVHLKFTGPGNLLKASIPKQAADLGLADMLVSLLRWFPGHDVSTGQSWNSTEPAVYSGGRSGIGRTLDTTYQLVSVDGDTAVINGAITINQSGGARVSTVDGPLNVNAIGAGKGKSRFEYDVAGNRMLSGETEIRFEGRLANVVPSATGEKSRSREGSFVETAKFTIRIQN